MWYMVYIPPNQRPLGAKLKTVKNDKNLHFSNICLIVRFVEFSVHFYDFVMNEKEILCLR